VLGSNNRYAVSATSPAFPGLAAADLFGFLALRGQLDETALVRQCRSWARQHLGGGPATP
jgi:hypothetical protein